jgi:hypothetical protein
MGNLERIIAKYFRYGLTLISPRLNAQVVHYFKFGRFPDLKNPKTFNEKLLKLKLENYDHNPLVRICADKYAVRNYVESREFGFLLNELIYVFDSVDEIDWNALPDKFAMKWNFGCGFNIICKDKSKLKENEVKKQMKRWGKERIHLGYGEMQYKGIEKKILVEALLEDREKELPDDYKIYCFHGKARAILFISGRNTKQMKGAFFTPDWDYIGVPNKKYHEVYPLPDRPHSLDTMIAAAEKLSSEFPFVRVDFYECNGKAVFGEMTFTPAGCHDVSSASINGVSMAEMLVI